MEYIVILWFSLSIYSVLETYTTWHIAKNHLEGENKAIMEDIEHNKIIKCLALLFSFLFGPIIMFIPERYFKEGNDEL